MINNGDSTDDGQLKQRLVQLEEQLAHELRVRGFDPAQRANIPLPPAIAKLSMEIELLREQVDSSKENQNE